MKKNLANKTELYLVDFLNIMQSSDFATCYFKIFFWKLFIDCNVPDEKFKCQATKDIPETKRAKEKLSDMPNKHMKPFLKDEYKQ